MVSKIFSPLFLPLALFCLGHNAASAQYTDTATHHIELSSTGSINHSYIGTTYLTNNLLDAGIKKKSIMVDFNNNYVYGKSNGALSNNDFSSTLELNLYKTFPHFFYWGLASYNTSYSLKITDQAMGGAGIAYSVLDGKYAYLNFSDGLLYDQSNLELPDSIREIYHTVRNSFRLAFKFSWEDKVVIDGADFLQNSLDRGNDYIIKSTTNLAVKLNKWLNLTCTLKYDDERRTQLSTFLFTYGFKLDKYF